MQPADGPTSDAPHAPEGLAPVVRPRALDRPGWVVVAYAFRALGGVALAAPLAVEIGALLARWPQGDAVLFEPGGELLSDVARKALPAAPGLAAAAGVGVALASFLGLAPLAALLAALGHRGPARAVLARAGSALGTLALLWGLALFAQAVVGGLAFAALSRAVGALRWAPPAGDLAELAVVGVVAALVVALGVLHDLARAVAVDDRRGLYVSVARAIDVVLARPIAVLGAYAARGALAAAALGLGGALAAHVGVATPARLAVAVAVQQASLFVAVALRASWLAAAIRHARAAAPDP